MTKAVTILSLATATPPHSLTQDAALAAARCLLAGQIGDFDRLSAVYGNAGIACRQLARPVEWYLEPRDFTERTAVYLEVALDLFVEAAEAALAEAGLATGIAQDPAERDAHRRAPVR